MTPDAKGSSNKFNLQTAERRSLSVSNANTERSIRHRIESVQDEPTKYMKTDLGGGVSLHYSAHFHLYWMRLRSTCRVNVN